LVAGSLDGGKLGLSIAHRKGFQQTFTTIPGLNLVKSVSCGTNHMIAICSNH
jgi:hypothetical protein